MRYYTWHLFVLIAVGAVACVALSYPSELTASLVFSVIVVVLCIALLSGIASTQASRYFWIGFALVGCGYLTLSRITHEDLEIHSSADLLVTTEVLYRIYDLMNGRHSSVASDPKVETDPNIDPIEVISDESRPMVQIIGGTIPIESDDLASFLRIGHSIFALLFAYLGGRFSAFLRTRSADNGV